MTRPNRVLDGVMSRWRPGTVYSVCVTMLIGIVRGVQRIWIGVEYIVGQE